MPFLEIRTTVDSVMPYDAHFHAEFSLGIILEGKTHFFLEGTPYTAKAGDIVLIAPGQVHSCNPVGGLPRSYHMLFFSGAWFEERITKPVWGCRIPVLKQPVISSAGLYAEAMALIEASDADTTGIVEKRLAALLHSALRRADAGPAPEEADARRKRIPTLSSELQSADGAAPCPINQLAAKANMRRESFSRLFRRKTGLPPKAYQHCLRIEKGRRLLRQGKSIAEAALEAGFTDQSHFHRMFVRLCSATPGCYRKNRSHSYKK